MSSLKQNILYNFTYQLLILFLPFITAPYLSRVLGASGIGIFSYSYSIATYFVYFAVLGLNIYGNRTIAIVRNDSSKLSKTFSEIYVMQIFTSSISIIGYISYCLCAKNEDKASFYQFFFVLSALFDINWFFFGLEKFKLTVIRNAIIKVLTVVLVFVFVKEKDDTYIYILILSTGTLFSQLALWPYVQKYVRFKFPKFKDVYSHLGPNLILFIPIIATSVYKILDKIMLGILSSMESVGYFENAEKIINVPIALISAIGTVMLPKISSIIAQGESSQASRYFDISITFSLLFGNFIAVCLYIVSDLFVDIYFGHDFYPSSIVIKLLSLTIVFLAIGNVFRTQYLIPHKLDNIYIKSAIYGAILNFLINIILIPYWDIIGASIGTIVTEIFVFLYQLFLTRKRINIGKYILLIVFFLIVDVLIIGMTYLEIPINNYFINIVFQLITTSIIFFLIAFFVLQKKKTKYNLFPFIF